MHAILALLLAASVPDPDASMERHFTGRYAHLSSPARDTVERLAACIHFSGEINGDRSDRDAEVSAIMTSLRCKSIDGDVAAVLERVAGDREVEAALEDARRFAAPEFAPSDQTPVCIPFDGCGCRVVVDDTACANGNAHFFHALNDGAALEFFEHGQRKAIESTIPATNSFTGDEGTSWHESYRSGVMSIDVEIEPGTSTCTDDQEGCEFFDVRARVLITTPQGIRRYKATGSCGC